MQLGMIGLGRMGANLVRRLVNDGHECVVHDMNPEAVKAVAGPHVQGAASLEELAAKMSGPRAVWVMVPAAVTGKTIEQLALHLQAGDIVIDGGNSHYRDDLQRAKALGEHDIHWIDCGTSGGIFGLERGYCLMIGGEEKIVAHLEPIFKSIAPGIAAAPRTPGKTGTPEPEEQGYLHCGPAGAGHFVKMVHNGIEYAMMAAYAEGLNILKHADAGMRGRQADAETAPLRDADAYQYQIDVGRVTEVWRRGSVVASWLLDLTAAALAEDSELDRYSGHVSDSGEGRWTLAAAVDAGVPVPVIGAALFSRFQSQGGGDYGNRVLSAMRKQFGGHDERKKDER